MTIWPYLREPKVGPWPPAAASGLAGAFGIRYPQCGLHMRRLTKDGVRLPHQIITQTVQKSCKMLC